MSTATADKHVDLEAATEAAPVCGAAFRLGVRVSDAERWLEDGMHVLRSTEFDVIAGDRDFDGALGQFIDKIEDLWFYLSGLEELTDNENETFLALAPRFLRIHQKLEQLEEDRRRRLISVSFGRLRRLQRGEPLLAWHQSSTPAARSSQPSAV